MFPFFFALCLLSLSLLGRYFDIFITSGPTTHTLIQPSSDILLYFPIKGVGAEGVCVCLRIGGGGGYGGDWVLGAVSTGGYLPGGGQLASYAGTNPACVVVLLFRFPPTSLPLVPPFFISTHFPPPCLGHHGPDSDMLLVRSTPLQTLLRCRIFSRTPSFVATPTCLHVVDFLPSPYQPPRSFPAPPFKFRNDSPFAPIFPQAFPA